MTEAKWIDLDQEFSTCGFDGDGEEVSYEEWKAGNEETNGGPFGLLWGWAQGVGYKSRRRRIEDD